MNLALRPFKHIDSSQESCAPSMVMTVNASSSNISLESCSTVGRVWAHPPGRTVRIASIAGDDFHVAFGTSTLTIGASSSGNGTGGNGSSNGMLVLGGTVEVFHLPRPNFSYMAARSSTDVTLNITLGYGN